MALKGLLSEEYYDNISADDVTMEEAANQENNGCNLDHILSSIPSKLEDCTKSHFCLVLLLIVEIKNIETDKEKIDFLLLFNFLNTAKEFETISKILKLTKDEFVKIFGTKTDFDTTKIAQIFDTFSSNDAIKSIVDKFKANVASKKINVEQTMSKIIKCELQSNTCPIQSDENEADEKDAEWKHFDVGNKIDVRDKWNKWYLSEIQRHKKKSDKISAEELGKNFKGNVKSIQNFEAIYVHYIGFAAKWNEWIIIESNDIFCECEGPSNRSQHRIAAPNTQSALKKKEKEKVEGIKYKIKDFDALCKCIGSKYEAPDGRNRSGMYSML